MLRDSWSRTGA